MGLERLKLGELLLKRKLITKEQLQSAIEYQRTLGGKLGQIVVKLGYISDDALTRELARSYNMGVTDLANQVLPMDLLKAVPKEIIQKHEIVPVHATQAVITIAMADPTDYEALDELQFVTGKKIEVTIATRDSIKRAIAEFLGHIEVESHGSLQKVKSAGKLRPASQGSLRALAEATESSLVDSVKQRLGEASPTINTSAVTRADLRSAVIPLLVKKGVITEGELFDAVTALLVKKGVVDERDLKQKAKEIGG
jgi:type IV pilus assembly protein PilB